MMYFQQSLVEPRSSSSSDVFTIVARRMDLCTPTSTVLLGFGCPWEEYVTLNETPLLWRAIPNEVVIVINRRQKLLHLGMNALALKGRSGGHIRVSITESERSTHIKILVHLVAFYVF